MVNVPKQKNTFCRKCKKHTKQKVSQYKTGKASIFAQGEQPKHSQEQQDRAQGLRRSAIWTAVAEHWAGGREGGSGWKQRLDGAAGSTGGNRRLQQRRSWQPTATHSALRRVSFHMRYGSLTFRVCLILSQASGGTTGSSPVSVGRQSPSSTRRRRPRRRSPCVWSAPSASRSPSSRLSVASTSSLARPRRSRVSTVKGRAHKSCERCWRGRGMFGGCHSGPAALYARECGNQVMVAGRSGKASVRWA